jgi:16S rRNA (cytosine967-C5)-methyltransferase
LSRNSNSSKPISPSRAAAFEILALVASGKGNSDDLLHSSHTAGLSVEDRNLATALVLGTLRWQIALDARIQALLQRPDQRLAEPVAIALRLGAFQWLHMDRIPPHAAINESVELVRASGNPHVTGMVNAILRKVMTQKARQAPIYESAAALAERLSHPQWFVERWIANYGRPAAVRICEAGQREPGAPELFPDSAEQDLPRMDDGSRLVAELAAAAAPGAGRVWDACAAPGGKSLILAKRLPDAKALATDVSPRRLAAMRTRIAEYPYAGEMQMEVLDATDPPASLGSFDLILADVPCSGTGTLARNPEIRLRLTPTDLSRHASRQRKIVAATLKHLEPGGRLLYSTCSLEPEECERVVEAVLAEKKFAEAVRVIPVEPLIGELRRAGLLTGQLEGAVRGQYLRTLPGIHPGDGFFAALLERIR